MTYPSPGTAGRRSARHSRPGGRPSGVPVRRGRGRRVVGALFWLGLVAAVLPWWLDTPAGSVAGAAQLLTAAGRITGLVCGYVLLTQVVLMSRLPVLESRIGAEDLTRLHRDLGGSLVVATLTHAALIIAGYARLDRLSVVAETGVLLGQNAHMVEAFCGAGILLALGLLSIRALRRALPHEVWHRLHLTSYAVLLLAFGHQFSEGQQLFRPGPVRWLWIAFYCAAIAAVGWGRILRPAVFNLRHRLRVANVVAENPDTISVYLTGRHLDRLDVRGGQFFRWRFLTRGAWTQAHPFSLSAPGNDRWLRITVKVVGRYTAELRDLRPDVRVWASGPSGGFTADRRTRDRCLLIAGGSGITPIRALLEELPPGATLIYRAATPADLLLRRELDWLAQARGTDVWYVVGSRDDRGPRHVLSPRGLRELVPDVAGRDVYLCGPDGLVDTANRALRAAGVPGRQIHRTSFAL